MLDHEREFPRARERVGGYGVVETWLEGAADVGACAVRFEGWLALGFGREGRWGLGYGDLGV